MGGRTMYEEYEQWARQNAAPKKKKGKKIVLILLCLLLCSAIGFAAFWFLTTDDRLYEQGVAYMKEKEYARAIEVFEQIPDYKDSALQITRCHYSWGNYARLGERFDEARQHYLAAGDYKDAFTQSQQMAYNLGHKAFVEGNYDQADAWFALVEDDITNYGELHFRTIEDAAPYLRQQQEQFAERVAFYVGEKTDQNFYNSLQNYIIHQHAFPTYYITTRLVELDKIVYYPGDRIYNAWKTGDTSTLSQQEQETLTLALSVVEQARAQTNTDLELQIWLHDLLCKQVTYESPNMDVDRADYLNLTELSCIGAMLEGRANCQGYTDAFALLGRLAGFEVSKLFGDTGGGHTWNIIKLDGLWYIVDVTFDDMSDEHYDGWHYTYFNTGWDPEQYCIYGGQSAAPELADEPHPTMNYFAYTQNSFTSVYDAAYDIVSQKLWEGKSWSYVKIEDATVSPDRFNNTVYSIVKSRIYGLASWTCYAMDYDGDSYMVIIWK